MLLPRPQDVGVTCTGGGGGEGANFASVPFLSPNGSFHALSRLLCHPEMEALGGFAPGSRQLLRLCPKQPLFERKWRRSLKIVLWIFTKCV